MSKRGLSKEDAIQFPLAKTAEEGIAAEYAWLKENMPEAEIIQQAFSCEGDRQYDILTIALADGDNIDIYFDITNFFGLF